jgi:hypothetical protein
LPTYMPFETEEEEEGEADGRHDVPVAVPTLVSQSPSLMSRRRPVFGSSFGDSSSSTKQRMQSTTFVNKLQKVRDQVSTARDEWVELRQEASDLQEYSTAKIHRVTRYLGVLADKARRLDQVALDSEARVTPLRKQKKRLFNDLLAVKGNVRVFCRVRPQFEDEGPMVTAFPDDFTLRINQSMAAAPVKEFEFDHVYGPHISQGDFFQDLQPLVQSALDGYNVSIFSYGQTGSGKTHTMVNADFLLNIIGV